MIESLIDRLIAILQQLKRCDKEKVVKELEEFGHYATRQIFNQIPAASGIAALLAGAWIASTFTTSPLKAALAKWGFIKGGRHVVSTGAYKFMSTVIPLLAAAIAAYLVQKALRYLRERRMQADMEKVSTLGPEVQAQSRERLEILDRAKEAGLITSAEHLAKRSNLYAAYSRTLHPKIEELLFSKLT